MKNIIARRKAALPDLHDLHLYGGIALIFYGLRGYDIRAAFIAAGLAFAFIGLRPLISRRRD